PALSEPRPRTAMCGPGPTLAESFAGARGVGSGFVVGGDGGGVVTVPTVNEPFITVECGSQTKVYVPSTSVIAKVLSPTKSTSVDATVALVPGPKRWKSWIAEWSCTTSVYVPGSRCVTFAPLASFSVIVNASFVPTSPVM